MFEVASKNSAVESMRNDDFYDNITSCKNCTYKYKSYLDTDLSLKWNFNLL